MLTAHRNAWSKSQNAGSALIVTVMLIAVLCLVAGTLLSYTSSKQAAPFQAASWHEAGAAAEGGVEVALNALRRSIEDPDNAWDGWQADPANGATAKKYITENQLLSHVGEGNTAVRAMVEVTQPTGAGTINPTTGPNAIPPNRYSFRIRSTGFANVPGPARMAVDKSDLALRKLNVFWDMRKNKALDADAGDGKIHPQMSRVVEAVATPVTPFPAAILSQDKIEMKGGKEMIVDSYDPTVFPYKYDPNKDYGDVTQPGNKRSNGNVCTNAKMKHDSDPVIQLEKVQIYGLAAKGKGSVDIKSQGVAPGANVNGQIIDGFYRTMRQYDPTKMAGFIGKPTLNTADRPKAPNPKVINITCGKGATGSNKAEGSYTKFKKVHLHKDEKLIIKAGVSPSSGNAGIPENYGWAEIWITEDLIIHNQGIIQVEDGARAIIYVGKNVTLQEKDQGHPAILNDTKYNTFHGGSSTFADPGALQFFGTVANHKKQHVKLKTNMAGVIYAPDHEFEVNLKWDNDKNKRRHIYGSLTGRKFKITGTSQINYDETLADIGKPIDYTLATWQEDWYDPAVRKP